MSFKSIKLTPGQVTTVMSALTLCGCGDVDDCPLCDAKRDAIAILATAKTEPRHEPLGDNEGLVTEEDEPKFWDKIEEALLAHGY